MNTSKAWINYFTENALHERIDWRIKPTISIEEIATLLHSLQAWQLGETSDGAHLIHASTLYAKKIGDQDYIYAVKLFICEEQKHGRNLGKYLDAIGEPRIQKNWGDTIFRKIRYFNTNMEIWTVAVITVESAAQVYYQCLKNVSNCTLLKQICTDILIDESYHIDFQVERIHEIFNDKSSFSRWISRIIYPIFFFGTSLVIWLAHKKVFKAGGTGFKKYMRKMKLKYRKTLHRIAFSKNKPHMYSGRDLCRTEPKNIDILA